ncbi:hypothetical protein [uncultured Maribacter sp.]|uniref:hypothetical protein n=1 Tax=uncultured Maribacter sp. TaxID=431308 RepID=UPI00261B0D03|nr:hypothetical protein [uncultured Maribacter sp.]
MISCEKAKLICNKAQYKEASFFEKIKLKMHLFICKACAGHSKKNGQLTELCSKANLHSLSEGDKELMKQKLYSDE